MPWGVAAAAVGAGGSLLAAKEGKKGGAGSSTSAYTPYATGDWIKNLAQRGSDISWDYQQNPFSAAQNAAYNNQYALSDSVRALVPSLLGQLGSQPVGFDPRNPTAKAAGFDWTQFMKGLEGTQQNVRGLQNTTASTTTSTPVAAPVAAPVATQSLFEYVPAGGA